MKSTKMVYKLLLAVMDASEGWPDQAPGDSVDGFAIDAASAEARKILLSALDRFYESKDDDVREWRMQAARCQGDDAGEPARWGEGIVWSEFHNSAPYPYAID